jgi:hypothetical protein
MSHVIFETCWNQKSRFSGVKEYYNIVKDVCSEFDNVELFGLFRPRTEPWNWAYFIGVDLGDTWQQVSDEVDRRYHTKQDNITQSINRWYSYNYVNPKPNNFDQLKYFQIELDVWEGINVGVKEYFDVHTKIFEGQEGVWYQGQYHVWNDPFNWAQFYWFRDRVRMRALSDACWRATGQLTRTPIIVIRHYERFEPD